MTPAGSSPTSFVELDGSVFFCADRSDVGREVFVSDGTESGTALLVDANPGPRSSFFMHRTDERQMVVLGERLLFVAETDGVGYRLWATVPWPGAGSPRPSGRLAAPLESDELAEPLLAEYLFGVLGDRLLFTALEAEHGVELWSTDGTSMGTHLVADLVPGPESSEIRSLVVHGELAYFTARMSTTGGDYQLWQTDG